MKFVGLDHVGFTVSDLNRSIDFYTFLLGEEPILRKAWEAEYVGRVVGYSGLKLDVALWRLPGGALLELLQYLKPEPGRVDMETYNTGNGHLCLVTEDIHNDFERLRDRATFRHPEPVKILWGPYEGGWANYIRDPDGISIELLQAPPGGSKI